MAELELLKGIEGAWQGKNRLQLSADEDVRESDSFIIVAPIILGKFHQINYTWVDEGQPQAGLLMLGYNNNLEMAMAVWLDSWHTSEQFMHLEGSIEESGMLNFKGSYTAPSGPDWGWRITLQVDDNESFLITMYNITPDGEELWAVKGVYERS